MRSQARWLAHSMFIAMCTETRSVSHDTIQGASGTGYLVRTGRHSDGSNHILARPLCREFLMAGSAGSDTFGRCSMLILGSAKIARICRCALRLDEVASACRAPADHVFD